MATLFRTSMVDHSVLDDTGDDINGSEVDANSYTIADIMDGTTQSDLASFDRIDALSAATHATTRESIRLINLDVAAAAVHDVLRLEWDPVSGSPINGQGVGIVWYASDSVNNQEEVASLDVVAIDVVSTTEDYQFDIRVMVAGTMTTVLTISGAGVTGSGLIVGSAYTTPILFGTARVWYDSANTTLRIKHGSNPSSATDGNAIMEG